MNLVPAKCPSCGASLQLDDNLKRVECQYCHATIVVDEAIEKYQLEINATVKISGIQDADDKIEIAKKHLRALKYTEAKNVLDEVLTEDPYNLEALVTKYDVFIFEYENKGLYYDAIEIDDVYKYPFYAADLDKYIETLVMNDKQNKYSDYLDEMKRYKEKWIEACDKNTEGYNNVLADLDAFSDGVKKGWGGIIVPMIFSTFQMADEELYKSYSYYGDKSISDFKFTCGKHEFKSKYRMVLSEKAYKTNRMKENVAFYNKYLKG